ncbi:hypothetical protein BaRGS_00017014 [Batillaria attramentaria]|uniref:Uncharacterized protein n=1 Tax=Batillaria attramentaria TaxID=370345 RepID=A0ABD0KX63_9CAEN
MPKTQGKTTDPGKSRTATVLFQSGQNREILTRRGVSHLDKHRSGKKKSDPGKIRERPLSCLTAAVNREILTWRGVHHSVW